MYNFEDGKYYCNECGAPATRGGGTHCDAHGLCHCGQPGINVGASLCETHLNEFRNAAKQKHAEALARAKERYRYFIPDYTEVSEFADAGPWRSYQVCDGQADTLSQFLDQVTISEVDQDGGDLDCYGFNDAPSHVQNAILKAIGATWDDVNEVSE